MMKLLQLIVRRPLKGLILLGIIVIALCLFIIKKDNEVVQWQGETKVVEVQVASLGDIRQCVRLIGILKPKKVTPLSSRASGILELHVKPGERVLKGALLVTIDDREIEKKYEIATSSEAIAKAQYERALALHESSAISSQTLEEKKTLWLEAERALYDAKTLWGNLRLTAPFEGIIGSFNLSEGAQVHVGDRLTFLYDPSALRVYFDIPSSILSQVHEGASVFIEEKKYSLTHVERMVDEETHMAKAYLDLPCEGSCDHHVIGTTIELELAVTEKKGVLIAPFESVYFQNGQTCIYTVEEGKTISHGVEIGLRDKDYVEILSGIEENDRIVIRGQNRLYPGMKVQVIEAGNKRS